MYSSIASIPTKLLRTFLLRGVTLWLLARIMGKAALASVSTSEAAGPLLSLWALVMTGSLMLVDLHRRRELALLQNLGVSTFHAVVVATMPALLLEALLVMLVP